MTMEHFNTLLLETKRPFRQIISGDLDYNTGKNVNQNLTKYPRKFTFLLITYGTDTNYDYKGN